jgi:L,D-transpeptidase catalytic domain/Putative peptidoglycan binding domain
VRRFTLTMAMVLAMLATLTPNALAGPGGDSVTLRAAKNSLKYGQWVQVSGRVMPPVEDEIVTLVDREDGPVRQVMTDAEGRYKTLLRPRENLSLRAETAAAQSDWVPIRVASIVKVNLSKVNLFGKAKVGGSIRPAQPGKKIVVRLYRHGKVMARKRVGLKDGRRFKTHMMIRKPGTHRARVAFKGEDLRTGSDASKKRSPSLRPLSLGSRGDRVRRLEKRLLQLGYIIPRADRTFGAPTRDAMYAFNKIQRRARTGGVTKSTWRALASPKRPKPRVRGPRNHIEIDQTRQVVMFIRNRKVKWILHTSTGAGGATRDGVFRVHRKIAGYSPGRLYYPSYFDGLRAIHGWPSVPNYPASHGCARIPMWAAIWAHSKAPMGTQVRVYH